MNKEARQQCQALTKASTQCKNKAVAGSNYCHVHQHLAVESAAGTKDEPQIPTETLSGREARRRLLEELNELILRVQELAPEYSPPAVPRDNSIEVINEEHPIGGSNFRLPFLRRLRSSINEDLLDVETWKGIWYMVNYTVEYQADILQRRMKGDYETDPWGLDWELLEAVRPFLDFMYKYYWRVKITGIEHIPDYEGAILVSNHSGQFPWDGAMIMTASLNEHPAQRLVRFLHSDWYPSLPFISSLLVKMGQVVDSVENGTRLLEEGEVIGVFPEGLGSLGKGFRNRYRLGRFEETTFAKLALKTGSWIIPVSVVGAEETYISLGKSRSLARLFKVPNFPVTMRFPWFGLFGMVPLPSKWYIDFGPPIDLNEFGEGAPEDPTVIATLADRVRETIQDMVRQRLENRGSIFY